MATSEHGDLLDLIRYRSHAPTLRAALDEARAFLALPASPDPVPGASPGRASGAAPGPGDAYDPTQAARRLWARCRAIDGTHAERYLLARGLARCRFAALRFHPTLRYREGSAVRRLPALVAAVTGVQRTWLDPRQPARAGVASPRKALGRKKELAGLIDGVRESAQSWRELLLDLKRRGLAVAPELAIADGALGFWKAIEEVWPRTRSQRCWVRRTPGSRSGCRCISASNTPTGRMPGLFSRIGTTSVSKISARGSGRRRPRGAAFPERRDGSSASRYPVARLKPAFAAATSIVWVFFRVMKSLFWRSVTWRPGTPALSSDSGKPKCCPTGHRRQEARGEIFARRRPETPVGLRPPSVPGHRRPSHPD